MQNNSMVIKNPDDTDVFYPLGGLGAGFAAGMGMTQTIGDSTFGTLSTSSPPREFRLLELVATKHDTGTSGDGILLSVEVYDLQTGGWRRVAGVLSCQECLETTFPLNIEVREEFKVAGFRVRGVGVGSPSADGSFVLNYML